MKLEEVSWRLLALLFASTLLPAAIEKFALAGETPAWFVTQFSPTFLARLPLGLSFYGIAALEAVSGLAFLVALIGRSKVRESAGFFWGLLSAEALFIALAFGQRLTHQFDQAAELFVYAFLTFVALRLRAKPAV